MEIEGKIKQEIRELLNRVTRADYDDDKISNFDYYIDDPKELVTLKNELAELRRDAELWRKVEELAAHYRHVGCAGCPEMNTKTGWCSGRCSTADAIVKALKEAP